MKKRIFPLCIALIALLGFAIMPCSARKTQRFEVGKGTFLLNGKPFVIKAAEMHYPRIPKEYWEQRIEMSKALGMNTICLYIFWNIHEQEEGKFDFSGNNDVAAFCRLAQKHGMYVIVRPGPYVCAEWEMGGLPWWLLKKKDIKLREQDPYFMERVRIFENRVGQELAPLQLSRGGNIIMVQVENEYGSYGEDKPYVAAIRDIVRGAGFTDVTLFQCDWSSNFTRNGLDDLLWTMNFGTGANVEEQFTRLKELRPQSPLMCSEFWSGWFDNWGRRHETRPGKDMVDGLRTMLKNNISFSLYMTHGGTSFGHWAGANSPGYAPDCTSYDYDAPISESGAPTPKFWQLRSMLASFNGGKPLPALPDTVPSVAFGKVTLGQVAPLFENLPSFTHYDHLVTMEDCNRGYGSILYRTTLHATCGQSSLALYDAHDYARVFVDGKLVGTLDRRNGDKELLLPTLREGAVLDIFVEAMGRINFGRAIKDYKGITDKVVLTIPTDSTPATLQLTSWEVATMPATYQYALDKSYMPLGSTLPAGYYKGSILLNDLGDTFLDMRSWGKGMVWVNGHALGRFWNIGPQQTLYLPGCWLKKGENEIVILDVTGPQEAAVQGLSRPILDDLRNPVPAVHRKSGETINLNGETVVAQGNLAAGNGWQEVKFDKPVTGRYLCLEALNAQKEGEVRAAVAELYLLDAQGKRLSREPWTVRYASSEETEGGNFTGDKVFDLQESTYWKTAKGDTFPHTLVIDLGCENTVTALQILPRMEKEVPGAIKGYRVYMSKENFKY